MNRSIYPSEHQIQCAIVEWARRAVIDTSKSTNLFWDFYHFQRCKSGFRTMPPDEGKIMLCIGDYLIAIPNGHKRSISEGRKIKKEGGKKGVSDLFLALPLVRQASYIYHGLWIEVKRKNGKLSKDQKEWIDLMRRQGYAGVVVDNVDDGIKAIKEYLSESGFWRSQTYNQYAIKDYLGMR